MTRLIGLHRTPTSDVPVIGFLKGEGVGPQLTEICLELLAGLSEVFGRQFAPRIGGPIGLPAYRETGTVIPAEAETFCRDVFEQGGAILAGPGGGRFVYEMRRRFRLFVKLNPIRSFPELGLRSRLTGATEADADILVVRENLGGLYQGASTVADDDGGCRVEHRFGCHESDTARTTDAAARLAAARDGTLTVVAKDAGLPDLSRLWFECGRRSAERYGVTLRTMDIDFAAYQLVTAPQEFDVVAVPNCFGDILSDLGGIVAGSRGCTFGGSFSERAAVYQTNHGSAHDLAGTDTANPVGHIFALAMMLRESYGMPNEADAIVAAVRETWSAGWRTADLMAPGYRVATTSQFGDLVLSCLVRDGRRWTSAAA